MAPVPATASPEEEALLRKENRAKLISLLVRYILDEEREEARARRVRQVRP